MKEYKCRANDALLVSFGTPTNTNMTVKAIQQRIRQLPSLLKAVPRLSHLFPRRTIATLQSQPSASPATDSSTLISTLQMSIIERSLSRGRDVYSTGRGGAGNIRSPSRDPVVNKGPEDFSDTRGREPVPAGDPSAVISTGRGGRGNIRSPSRDAVRGDNASTEASPLRSEERGRGYDRELIMAIDSAYDHDQQLHSVGRGGTGNMVENPDSRPGSLSRSRSRSREPSHASGRGGLGNIHRGGPTEKDIEEQDEFERASHLHPAGLHSVGRGGTGNITPGELPHLEDAVKPHDPKHPHASHVHDAESTGRGGSGNITHEHAPKDTHHHGHGPGVSNLLHGIVRS